MTLYPSDFVSINMSTRIYILLQYFGDEFIRLFNVFNIV